MYITANIHAFCFTAVQKQKSSMFLRLRLMLHTRVSYTLFIAHQSAISAIVLK